ncbi:MAG: HAMP domain-containing sensor histidine kinase [Deltaproteobacteria bacterium]|nr:HAMP domain-containing sensor histidine kinase [Deltaproteobacteria bacterium]
MFSNRSDKPGISFSMKLSLMYALFFAVSAVGLFAVAYYLIEGFAEQREREMIRDRIEEYRAWYMEGGLRALEARFERQTNRSLDIFFVRVVGPLNQVLFVSIPEGIEGLDPGQLKAFTPTGEDLWVSIRDRARKSAWTLGMAPLPGGLTLQVGKSTTEVHELLSYFQRIFVVFVIPILILAVVGGGMMTFRAIRPIRRLIHTVRHILKTGETSRRVAVKTERGEMNELVGLFNQLLDRNDALIQAMHNSLDNVAHDLRTPMTRLRGTAELALQTPNNAHACREALADCMEESERVLTMLNTLMDVGEAETGAMRLKRVPVDVPEMIQHIVDLYEVVAEESGVTIHTDIPEGLVIQADRTRLQQVVANLMDNALKYIGNGQEITISATLSDQTAILSITDDGLGIGPSDINRIWDRLYREDRSRSKRGLGLGLSFVKAIVEAHGGTVSVESRVNQGATFTIRLPIKPT